MKKILTILLFAFTLTAGAQNIWRAPSVFEQWVNFSNTVTQTHSTDSVYLQFVNGRWVARKDSCYLSVGTLDANIGKIDAYSLGAGGNFIDFKKAGTDTINLYFRNDTAFVDGKSKVVAWQFNPPLPTSAGGVDTIYRTPGIDSIYFTIDGVTYAILDSAGGGGGSGWSLTGNAGTNPATDFLGPTDNADLIFKRNNRAYGYFGSTNIALGDSAGFYHGAGDYNIFLGYEAGKFDAPSGAANNICIGYQAGLVNASSQNIFIGDLSGYQTTTSANLNTFIGSGSGQNNIGGYENTLLGANAGQFLTTGTDNVAVGYASLQISTGNNNTAIGRSSTIVDGTSNATAIGYSAMAGCANCVSIGDSSNANIGIGTAYPSAKLDVRGSIRMVDGNQAAGKVLTSDANGLANWQPVWVKATGTGDTVTINGTAIIDTTNTLTTAANSSTTITITNSYVTTASVVTASMGVYSGTVGLNGIPLVTQAIAGSGVVYVTVSNVSGATALNGTLVIYLLIAP